ncbi:hypothetical protein ACFL54_05700 [Planctomycetota bacterium]
MSTTMRINKLKGLKERVTMRLESKLKLLRDAVLEKHEKITRLLELRDKVTKRVFQEQNREDKLLLKIIDESIHEVAVS